MAEGFAGFANMTRPDIDAILDRAGEAVDFGYRLGQQVRVRKRGSVAWTSDWQGDWIIVSLRHEYQKGDGTKLNIGIASVDEIEHRMGSTDCFSPDDFEGGTVSDTTDLARYAISLEGEVKRLREALEPFALVEQRWNDDGHEHMPGSWETNIKGLRREHFRAARDALKGDDNA